MLMKKKKEGEKNKFIYYFLIKNFVYEKYIKKWNDMIYLFEKKNEIIFSVLEGFLFFALLDKPTNIIKAIY